MNINTQIRNDLRGIADEFIDRIDKYIESHSEIFDHEDPDTKISPTYILADVYDQIRIVTAEMYDTADMFNRISLGWQLTV